MSTDRHNLGNGNLPEHDSVSFEPRDISISSVLWSLFYLAVTIVVSLGFCVLFLKYSTKFAESKDRPRPMVRQQMSVEAEKAMTTPEGPMLQGVPPSPSDPQQDLRDKMSADTKANESFGWVDEKAGIAQIPVKEAMKIIAEKGLPDATTSAPEKNSEKKK